MTARQLTQQINIVAATILTGLLAVSCAPQSRPPEQIGSSNPTVTYRYFSDQDLIQANQSAAVFCSRYQASPRGATMPNDRDGTRVVKYDCVPTTAQLAPQQPLVATNVAYNYRTDQELLDGSRSAQVYCMNNGSQQVSANVVTNANGTKTATFNCVPR